MVCEVAAAIGQHGFDRGDRGVDVGGLGLGARGALLGHDLLVLALLRGVLAVAFLRCLPRAALLCLTRTLPVEALLALLALDGEVVAFPCFFEPSLLPLVALTLLPHLPSKRLALRHLLPQLPDATPRLSVGSKSLAVESYQRRR